MAAGGEEYQLDFLFAYLEGHVHLLRLLDVAPVVVLGVGQEERGVDVVGVGDGGPLQVEGGALLGRSLEFPVPEHPGEVAGTPRAVEVRYEPACDGCFEAVRVPDYPGRHVATVGTTTNSHPQLVNAFMAYGVVYAGHNVIVIHTSPVVDDGVGEYLPVALAATRVRVEDDITLRCQHLELVEVGVAVCRVRAAVYFQDHRVLLAFVVAGWEK